MVPAPQSSSSFLTRVEALFGDIVSKLDVLDPDELEAERAEGVLRLTFGDGSKCILNRQSAAQQIWLAEGASAWHFDWDEATRTWSDSKGRGELLRILGDVIERKLGRRVRL